MENMEFSLKYSFKEYIYKNRYILMLGSIILLAIYGKYMYTINTRIDTELLVNDPQNIYNWLDIGRPGAVFTRILFEQINYNQYYLAIVALALLIISIIFFGYLTSLIGNINSKIAVTIFLIFMIHPIWVEQFYFSLQIVPISLAILLTIIASIINFKSILNNNKFGKVFVIPLIIWIISTYQVFAVLYISMIIFSYILFYINQAIVNANKEINEKIYIKLIYESIAIFLIAFILNQFIVNTFFIDGTYINSQIAWGSQDLLQIIKNIVSHILSVIKAEGIFYTYSYILSVILIIISTLYITLQNVNIKQNYLYVAAIIGLQLTPFLLTIYSGAQPTMRAQLVLPFVIACNLGLSYLVFREKKYISIIIIGIFIIIFMKNSQIVMRMQYTDDIRFKEDVLLTSQIVTEIERVSKSEKKPIAIIGTKTSGLNASCIRGELIGLSFFDFGHWAEPHYFHSTRGVVGVANSIGYKIQTVSDKQMIEARTIAYNMPKWPTEGSVYDAGEFVIVKISDDEWYNIDILETNLE